MGINVIPTEFVAPEDNYPFPSPFILSSVEKDWCRFQANKAASIVFIKRRHLEENLKTIAPEIGMDEAERKNFLDWWCSPSTRNPEEVRAELDECFNLRRRVENWMERARTGTRQTQKSRLEKYAESAKQFFGASQEVSPGPSPAQGFGYTNIPDEQ